MQLVVHFFLCYDSSHTIHSSFGWNVFRFFFARDWIRFMMQVAPSELINQNSRWFAWLRIDLRVLLLRNRPKKTFRQTKFSLIRLHRSMASTYACSPSFCYVSLTTTSSICTWHLHFMFIMLEWMLREGRLQLRLVIDFVLFVPVIGLA